MAWLDEDVEVAAARQGPQEDRSGDLMYPIQTGNHPSVTGLQH